jgi:hypothetical protein
VILLNIRVALATNGEVASVLFGGSLYAPLAFHGTFLQSNGNYGATGSFVSKIQINSKKKQRESQLPLL